MSEIRIETSGREIVISSAGVRGAQGPTGSTGAQGDSTAWLTGNGVPSNGAGDNGDLYLDKLTGDVYLKTSGSWSLDTNIQGPAGADAFLDMRQLAFIDFDNGPFEAFPTAYREITMSGAYPTSVVWYVNASKAQKIAELQISYTGLNATQEVRTIYQSDGVTPLHVATDTVTFSGVQEVSRSRVFT